MPLRRAVATALVAISLLALAYIDYATGPDLDLSLLYVLPVAYAGRYFGRSAGLAMAVLAAAAWLVVEAAWRGVNTVTLWHAFARLLIFAGAGSVMASGRTSERRLAAMDGQLQRMVAAEKASARIDPLTSLANGRMFVDEIHRALARLRHDGEPIAVAYMDLDNFKMVNDRYGHTEGDAVLKQVASAISAVIREGDLAARVGGDEFALLLHGCTPEALPLIGGRLLRQVASVASHYSEAPLTASIGLAHFTTPPEHVDAAIRTADQTMRIAKDLGKNRVEVTTDRAVQAG